MNERIAYTVPELAASASVSPYELYDAIQSGRLAASDIRRPGSTRPRYRVLREDAESWLKSMRFTPA